MEWKETSYGIFEVIEGDLSITLSEKECIIKKDEEIRKLSIEPEYNIMGNECLAFYLESEDSMESEFEVILLENKVCMNFVRVTKAIEKYAKECI